MSRKSILYSLVIGVFVIASACGMCFQGLNEWISYSPSEYPLQRVEKLVRQAIQPTELAVHETQEYKSPLEKECIALLREILVRNDNQYSLVVDRVMGDNGTPVPGTGADEVVILVEFPDRTQVEVYFYIGTLENCRKLGDRR